MSAAVNLSIIEKTIKCKTGDIITKNNENKTTIPIEFFIKTLPAKTISKPSLNRPPTIGIEFDNAYFATLNDIPSYFAPAIPCTPTKKLKTDIIIPKIHLIADCVKSENLFNFIVVENPETTLNAVVAIINGSIAIDTVLIIPPDKNIDAGLYTLADTLPPLAIIKVIIMGDIISIVFPIVSIVFLTI